MIIGLEVSSRKSMKPEKKTFSSKKNDEAQLSPLPPSLLFISILQGNPVEQPSPEADRRDLAGTENDE